MRLIKIKQLQIKIYMNKKEGSIHQYDNMQVVQGTNINQYQ